MRSYSALDHSREPLHVQGKHIRRTRRPHSASKSEITTTTQNLSAMYLYPKNKDKLNPTDKEPHNSIISSSQEDVSLTTNYVRPKLKCKELPFPFWDKSRSSSSNRFLSQKICLQKQELKMEELILLDKMNLLQLEMVRKPGKRWYAAKDKTFYYESAKNTLILRNKSDMEQKLLDKMKERKKIEEAQWLYAQLYDLNLV